MHLCRVYCVHTASCWICVIYFFHSHGLCFCSFCFDLSNNILGNYVSESYDENTERNYVLKRLNLNLSSIRKVLESDTLGNIGRKLCSEPMFPLRNLMIMNTKQCHNLWNCKVLTLASCHFISLCCKTFLKIAKVVIIEMTTFLLGFLKIKTEIKIALKTRTDISCCMYLVGNIQRYIKQKRYFFF